MRFDERFQDMLTTGEASQLTGLSLSQLTKLCRSGRVASVRRGGVWFLQRAALIAYLKEWHPEIRIEEGKED